jgi:hypothetical protein
MEQGRCPYFREYARQLGRLMPTLLPYCEHKHSPVTRDVVVRIIGAERILTCGGEWKRCQVPRNKRLDTA